MTDRARDEQLDFKDLMDELGLGDRALRELIKSGKGPAMYLGGRILCYRAWVERWLEGKDGFWSLAIAGGVPAQAPAPYAEPISFQLVPINGHHR